MSPRLYSLALLRLPIATACIVLAGGCSDSGDGTFAFPEESRSIDAGDNNLANPEWGSADAPFVRLCTPEYGDGTGAPSGSARPNPRSVSSLCAAQTGSIPSAGGISDFIWQWGQFLDHDMDLVPVIDPAEPFDIPVPAGDPFFDPLSTGTQTIPLDRSFFEMVGGVRQQVNVNTAYIDASNVYGSDDARAMALRTLDGTGRLKTSAGDLLPFNTDGLPNAPSTDPGFFVAGDFRTNEQVGLTVMHTLFVREHNYWADRIGAEDATLDDEAIYQRARMIVAAEMQAITYNEFLPILLGPDALGPYTGYRPSINAGISNEFATAAYRVGHTMLSPQLLRLDAALDPIPAGPLALRDAFFNPAEVSSVGLEPYLRGLATQVSQEVDAHIIDDVRNFLFGPPGSGGFDLASLNIQRGRDHGLPDYNQVRTELGLPPVSDFAEISSDPEVQSALATAYGSVDDLDLWMAGICEDHVPGALVGETFWTILTEQFLALRDGDRFWYERYLPLDLQREVERSTLAEIIRRNTAIEGEIPDNVFRTTVP